MGHRLSKIYTRTGDSGTTGLGDGTRTAKDGLRIEAIGSVDELNCAIGLLLAEDTGELREPLMQIQHQLFDLGGELCMPGHTLIDAAQVTRLEQWLDQYNEQLPHLKEFILPGGGRAAAACHLARAICRRAERRMSSLARDEAVSPPAMAYLNRLSDLLFVFARVLARESGAGEVLWEHERDRP